MSLTTITISDLPLWVDHPFVDVPEWLEIRRGEVGGEQVAFFSDITNDTHAHATGDVSNGTFVAIVRDLQSRKPRAPLPRRTKAEREQELARAGVVKATRAKERAERKAVAEAEKAAKRRRIEDGIIEKARAILAKRGEKL